MEAVTKGSIHFSLEPKDATKQLGKTKKAGKDASRSQTSQSPNQMRNGREVGAKVETAFLTVAWLKTYVKLCCTEGHPLPKSHAVMHGFLDFSPACTCSPAILHHHL